MFASLLLASDSRSLISALKPLYMSSVTSLELA
jgi:hypothetical protein